MRITTRPPFVVGQLVWIRVSPGLTTRGKVKRAEDQEVLVQVMGEACPFQRHDGKHWECEV